MARVKSKWNVKRVCQLENFIVAYKQAFKLLRGMEEVIIYIISVLFKIGFEVENIVIKRPFKDI